MSTCLACYSEKRVCCDWTSCLDIGPERTNHVKSVAPNSKVCHAKRSWQKMLRLNLHIARGLQEKERKEKHGL